MERELDLLLDELARNRGKQTVCGIIRKLVPFWKCTFPTESADNPVWRKGQDWMGTVAPVVVRRTWSGAMQLVGLLGDPAYQAATRWCCEQESQQLALMERPPYVESRIRVFAQFCATIREYCGLPAGESGNLVRPDGEDDFWEYFRAVLRRTEEDLPWALEQVLAVQDYEMRRYLFTYLQSEFCHMR